MSSEHDRDKRRVCSLRVSVLWVPETVSPHAACEYSWSRPPSRPPAQNAYIGYLCGQMRTPTGQLEVRASVEVGPGPVSVWVLHAVKNVLVFRIDSAYYSAAVLGAIRGGAARFSVTVRLDSKIRTAIAAGDLG